MCTQYSGAHCNYTLEKCNPVRIDYLRSEIPSAVVEGWAHIPSAVAEGCDGPMTAPVEVPETNAEAFSMPPHTLLSLYHSSPCRCTPVLCTPCSSIW